MTRRSAAALEGDAAAAAFLASRYREIAEALGEDLGGRAGAAGVFAVRGEDRNPVRWARARSDQHRRRARRLRKQAVVQDAVDRGGQPALDPDDPAPEAA